MEKRAGEAVTQQATSWAQLLRHMTGEEDPRDLAGAACSHGELGLYLSTSPPSPQT